MEGHYLKQTGTSRLIRALRVLPVRFLSNNRISALESGCFHNLSGTLEVLKLNRNRLASVPPKIFQLPHLQHL